MEIKGGSLKRTSEFKTVYTKGRSYAKGFVVMYVYRHGQPVRRVGFTISKKIGNAVTRNRVKRLFREAYRLHQDRLQAGFDLVFVARRGSAGKKYAAVAGTFLALFQAAKIEKENAGEK